MKPFGATFLLGLVFMINGGLAIASPMPPPDPSPSPTPNSSKVLTFDHLKMKSDIREVDLTDGEPFIMRIENTCESAFTYSFDAFERVQGDRAEGERAEKPKLSPKDIPVVHDRRFGGYVFRIAMKDGAKPPDCEGGDTLKDISFVVTVREDDWRVSFSGGFTVSGLTNPVFALKTTTTPATGAAPATTTKTIVEESSKRDKHHLGFASFVHLTHDRLSRGGVQPALAFGLGIKDDNSTEYLIGLGLKMSDKATINVGRAWGPISELPAGTNIGDVVTNDNILSTLGRRTDARWFVALSYSFIGGAKDKLSKPFLDKPAAAAPTGNTSARASAPGGAPTLEKPDLDKIETEVKKAETFNGIQIAGAANRTPCSVKADYKGSTEDNKLAIVQIGLGFQGVSAAEITGLTDDQMKPIWEAVKAAVKKAKPETEVKKPMLFACKAGG